MEEYAESFLEIGPTNGFPLTNLPYGIFSTSTNSTLRVGVAIGDYVADLSVIANRFCFPEISHASEIFQKGSLNNFVELGPSTWKKIRNTIQRILSKNEGALRDNQSLQNQILISQNEAYMHLPVEIDFSASKKHAENDRIMFTDRHHSVVPNWHYIPVAYHSRASSVVVSGTPICRPKGQVLSTVKDLAAQAVLPEFSVTAKLDYEAELGTIIGVGNDLGSPILVEEAESHAFGMVLMNDWSARDIQEWEWAPLGPFLCKSFATTISPWVVTMTALEPFRIPASQQKPAPLPYLLQEKPTTYDIRIDVTLQTQLGCEREFNQSSSNYKHMYWTLSQQIAHHTSNGCNLQPGDLLGSGTISGPTHSSSGSLSELSHRGTVPFKLENGEKRAFLKDGDTVIIRGNCENGGLRLSFGTCSGTIFPAT